MMIVVMLAVTVIVRMIVMLVIVLRVTMIMVAVIMMAVTMRRVAAAGIGSAFRIERRLDGDDARAETSHHLLDDMIAPDAKALADDLGRQMAVAEMPRDPDQMMRIGATDFHQRLRRGHDLDQPSVFQHQRIAAAQRHRFLQVQQEFESARAGHRHAAPVPVVETENHRIGGSLGPTAGRTNLHSADHDVTLIASELRRR